MSRLDRTFADYRARALAAPLTAARRLVTPGVDLPGGISIALSVNK